MIDVRLTDEMNPSNIGKVADVLTAERLFIPTQEDYGSKHQEWVEETPTDARRALLATDLGTAAGVIVWRTEEGSPGNINIRNISVPPIARGRNFGSFLLRTAEYAMREEGACIVHVDTKTTNKDMIVFLESQGYKVIRVDDLYDSGKPDIVLGKQLASVV